MFQTQNFSFSKFFKPAISDSSLQEQFLDVERGENEKEKEEKEKEEKEEKEEKMCRICHDNEEDEAEGEKRDEDKEKKRGDEKKKEFVSPCKCNGSLKYVHKECLDRWRNSRTPYESKCPQCLEVYSYSEEDGGIKINKKFFSRLFSFYCHVVALSIFFWLINVNDNNSIDGVGIIRFCAPLYHQKFVPIIDEDSSKHTPHQFRVAYFLFFMALSVIPVHFLFMLHFMVSTKVQFFHSRPHLYCFLISLVLPLWVGFDIGAFRMFPLAFITLNPLYFVACHFFLYFYEKR